MTVYPMRYVSLFSTVLILLVGLLSVKSYTGDTGRAGTEKEFSTGDFLTWEDWAQEIKGYISRCSPDGEGIACYLSLVNPERDEKFVVDIGYAYLKGDTTKPFPTVYFVPNGVWVVENPYSFSLNCPQGPMTFCEVMDMPAFIPWSDYDSLLSRFRRMEKYHVSIAVESSLRWNQFWTPMMKLYEVVGMDRLYTIYSWENVSFCQFGVSPARPPAPGAESEVVAVIRKLAELVMAEHKEDSPKVQRALAEFYRLKQMYPTAFSNVIRTHGESLKNVFIQF